MVAVITGDIINSEAQDVSKWLSALKGYLMGFGRSPEDWEIYRGDEFQLRVNREEALKVAIHLKSIIKSIKYLDVRISIGLGLESYIANRVSESNGPVYSLSGRNFDTIKQTGINLTIATGHDFYDHTLNLILKLALDFMDNWSTVSAEIVALALQYPQATQKEIAKKLGIQQSAVSQRQKRARLELVHELLAYYGQTLRELTS